MSSVKTGTVPENGKGIRLAGSLSIESVRMVKKDSKSLVCLEVEHDGYGLDLFFTPAQIVSLKEMIERSGISHAKEDSLAMGRHEFNMGLDLSLGGISVEVTPPDEDVYDDPTFAILDLKDRQGNKASLDLSLDVAQQIRKKLDAYFTAERERQTARLE